MKWFEYNCQVHFADTDAARVAHFSRILCWVEEAEHAFWRQHGFAVHDSSTALLPAPVGWPRVGVDVRFRRPLRLDDVLTVALAVVDVHSKMLVWKFQIRVQDEIAVEGKMTVAAVEKAAAGNWQVTTIPAQMKAVLEPYCVDE